MNITTLCSIGNAVINKDDVISVIADKNCGIATSKIESLSSYVELHVFGSATNDVNISLMSYDSQDNMSEVAAETVTPDINNKFEYKYNFDPVSLNIYKDAVAFEVRILSCCANGRFDIEYIILDETEDMDYADTCDYSALNTDESGNLTVAVKHIDGSVGYVDAIPEKVLFVGNSILLGMHTTYGMCASSPDNDYAYLVSDYIKKCNGNCMFSRLSVSDFEHSESFEMYEDWMYRNPNSKTMRPAVESFERDTDLIILQLGDNINNDIRRSVFRNNAEDLLQKIKIHSPDARIIWVYGWYGTKQVFDTICSLTSTWGIETVFIRPLYTKENQAKIGMEYYNPETEAMSVVKDTWVTHPGDAGMKKIAELIINKLGI